MGNMYDFVKKTKNPLAGECAHKCSYCYVSRMKNRFPKLKQRYSGRYRVIGSILEEPLRSRDMVFLCDCNDLFAEAVPAHMIHDILMAYRDETSPILLQTKNPRRIGEFIHLMPQNVTLCTTIETNRVYKEMGHTPNPRSRAIAMSCYPDYPVQVTIEPIMDFDLKEMVEIIRLANPAQVNIGADSGNNHLPEPSRDKVLELISELRRFTAVKRKRNLERITG